MEIKDFLTLESAKVRQSPDLFALYLKIFIDEFGYSPSCSSCSFNNDFRKLQQHFYNKSEDNTLSLTLNTKYDIMGQFKLKTLKHEILFYTHDGKKYRQYDYLMDIKFVIGFLTHGSEEELIERRELFKIIPDELSGEKSEEEVKDIVVFDAVVEGENKAIEPLTTEPNTLEPLAAKTAVKEVKKRTVSKTRKTTAKPKK